MRYRADQTACLHVIRDRDPDLELWWYIAPSKRSDTDMCLIKVSETTPDTANTGDGR